MPLPTNIQEALTRLGSYNGSGYDASTNPYGLDDDGHRINFVQALKDLSLVANWIDAQTLSFAGDYSALTTYETGAVTADGGSSWVATQDVPLAQAPPTLPTISNTYWFLLAAKGDKGDLGDPGEDGSNGVDGFAPGFRFSFSTTTTDSDPGAGVVRANNATFAAITSLFIDNTDAAAADVTAWLDRFDDSTSTNNRGSFRISAADNVGVYMDFVVTGDVVDGAGYRKVPVAPVASAGVFGDARAVVLTFQRSGDTGAAGAGSGDMLAAAYDPTNVAGDAFAMGNMSEAADAKVLTAAERAKLGHVSVTQSVDLDAIESRVNGLDAAVVLKGQWDASAGTFPGGGAAQAGESWIVSVAGTVGGEAFAANDRIIAVLDNASTVTFAANWHKADYTDEVLSVAGRTGAVVLAKADVGLGSVDNTADADKPVSTAQQSALDGKAASGHTHTAATGATPGFMSAADKTKLDAAGSMANRALTVSTLDPSGGADGDVWFKVT